VDPVQEDGFVLFVRTERSRIGTPEAAEHELYYCSTYEEARQLRRQQRQAARDCVIRYVGRSGGGD
jgi:hypothetical protein